MGSDRRLLDHERRGDLAVSEAASDQLQNLALAGGEFVELGLVGKLTMFLRPTAGSVQESIGQILRGFAVAVLGFAATDPSLVGYLLGSVA